MELVAGKKEIHANNSNEDRERLALDLKAGLHPLNKAAVKLIGIEMVFNSPVIVGVAKVSANACQYIACNPERLSGDQVLRLLFCFPFQQLRRLAFCLWTFFCFPPPNNPFLDSSSQSESDLDPTD